MTTSMGLPIKDGWIISTNKKERAPVIMEYAKTHKYDGIVVFSIGDSLDLRRAMMMSNLNLISVSPGGDLQSANKWWTQDEIKTSWPNYFDATSGHLPVFLLNEIVIKLRSKFLGMREDRLYMVPTGSGETVLCMAMAFPKIEFHAVYNIDKYTQWNPNAPLNDIVKAVANVHYDLPRGSSYPTQSTGKTSDEENEANTGLALGSASPG